MILITGATGFIGSYLLYQLIESGRKVRVLMRPTSSLYQIRLAYQVLNKNDIAGFDTYCAKIEFAEGNLNNTEFVDNALEGIDEVFHLAAMVSFRKKDNHNILESNVSATEQLLELCSKRNIRKFHYASSIASLNRGEDELVTDEFVGEKKSFTSTYSKSKYLAEQQVWKAYKNGLTGVIVNPGVVLGPVLDFHESVRVFKTIQKGFKFYTKGVNGYVDVRDVADIFFRLSINEQFYKQRYLLVSESVSYKDLFGWMAECFQIQAPHKLAGKKMSRIIAIADYIISNISGKKQVITRDLVNLVNSAYYFDSSKVVKALDYQFIPIKETVRDTIKYL